MPGVSPVLPADVAAALDPIVMTGVVNELKSPQTFLQNALFSAEDPQPTEILRIDIETNTRTMAPFVMKNGSAYMVPGYGAKRIFIEAPNIRIKTPVDIHHIIPSTLGPTPIYVSTAGQVVTVAQREVAKLLQNLADLETNRKEWMCAQALTGAITYSRDEKDSWTVVFDKPVAHEFTANPLWSTAGTNPIPDILLGKRLIADAHGLPTTLAIGGKDAAAAFLSNDIIQKQLDNRNLSAGQLTLIEQFTDQGALFLGNYAGILWWEYARTVVDDEGSLVNLIDPKTFHLVSPGPQAQNVMYYGPVIDVRTVQSGQIQTRRFTKSWFEEDPGDWIVLLHSRPLPVMRRPGSVVSIVVAA